MSRTILAVCLLFLASLPASLALPPPVPRDLEPDTWVATDGLGRTLPTAGMVHAVRKDKFVGIFYFVWHSRSDHAV